MSCYFCKNYKGLHNFCEDDYVYVETGNESLDCNSYEYNGELKYYSYLSKRDEQEVQAIIRRVVSYIIRLGFDEMSVATHQVAVNVLEMANAITNNMECLNEAK